MSVVAVIASTVVGATLLWAAVGKLRMRNWPVLAAEMGVPRFVIVTLPAFEAIVGLALVLQQGRPVVPWIAVMMFAAFAGVVVRQFRSKIPVPCNCFGGRGGSGSSPVGVFTLARNAALLVLAVLSTQT